MASEQEVKTAEQIKTERPWLWKKGQSGNPAGTPKRSIQIVPIIRKKLEEVPAGQQKNYAEIIVDTILVKAIKEKDFNTLKLKGFSLVTEFKVPT